MRAAVHASDGFTWGVGHESVCVCVSGGWGTHSLGFVSAASIVSSPYGSLSLSPENTQHSHQEFAELGSETGGRLMGLVYCWRFCANLPFGVFVNGDAGTCRF